MKSNRNKEIKGNMRNIQGMEVQRFAATNALESDGAALLLYDNVLRAFSDQIKKDYYIIPSSVDELMFIPDNEIIESEILRDCLCDSNKKTLPSEKILSEHIYHYSRSSGTLTML